MHTAVPCSDLKDIKEKDWQDYDVIGIDEGQFFDDVSDILFF